MCNDRVSAQLVRILQQEHRNTNGNIERGQYELEDWLGDTITEE